MKAKQIYMLQLLGWKFGYISKQSGGAIVFKKLTDFLTAQSILLSNLGQIVV